MSCQMAYIFVASCHFYITLLRHFANERMNVCIQVLVQVFLEFFSRAIFFAELDIRFVCCW